MRKILLLISMMKGGGAERVAALLLNEFRRRGCECEYMMTSCRTDEAVRRDLDEDIVFSSLQDNIPRKVFSDKLGSAFASAICKPAEALGRRAPLFAASLSFRAQYGREIELLRKKLISEPDTVCIAFLQPSIPILMLAADGLPNKVIFSERADPHRLMRHRYGEAFIRRYYGRADAAVFQTKDAMQAYPPEIAKKGVVIPNPIKDELPLPYHGARNTSLTTFCRISRQKNLPVLIKAFAEIHDRFPEYTLRIIGDAVNNEGKLVLDEIKSMINALDLKEHVELLPFNADVHSLIIRDAVYINSSDYEGISNAMLESMAIGLPCVCTDCPIGGAAQTIKDGENGLLVPVNDPSAIASAVTKILEDEQLSDALSRNAAKIRDSLSLEKTADRWLEVIRQTDLGPGGSKDSQKVETQ